MDYDYDDYERHRIHISYSKAGPCPCGPCTSERQAVAIPAQPDVAPREANILKPASRVGDTHRQKALTVIDQMEDGGYLTPEEAEARRGVVDQAKTSAQLLEITRDLPSPPDRRGPVTRYVQDYDFGKKQYFIPAMFALMIGVASVGVVPTSIAGTDGWIHTPHGIALSAVTIVAAVLGTIVSALILGDMWLDANKKKKRSS